GAFPVLIAWAAVRGTIEWPAVVLFVVIFLWTPPHYWPLSLKYKEDYQEVDVPMLGAIATSRRAPSQVVLYTCATVIFSLLLVPMGWACIDSTAAGAISVVFFLYVEQKLCPVFYCTVLSDKSAMTSFQNRITIPTPLIVSR